MRNEEKSWLQEFSSVLTMKLLSFNHFLEVTGPRDCETQDFAFEWTENIIIKQRKCWLTEFSPFPKMFS